MITREIMDTSFHTLSPDHSIFEAVELLKKSSEDEEKKIFGMMVTDKENQLVGMLSMFDILLFIQPKHIRILGEMEDISFETVLTGMMNRLKKIRVEDLMSTDLLIITPETNLMVVSDIMINKHIRRIPVVENNKVVGIVYRSDLFFHLMGKITE
ncbi:MAG: CBS domain-containing protein [Desulfobacterales bacterium]|nr:CBS domain-containing protein [Desulfobacterales bacterium]MCP4163078.1 CBS domain-containing protein [Deltaproteobacteria bacterium]